MPNKSILHDSAASSQITDIPTPWLAYAKFVAVTAVPCFFLGKSDHDAIFDVATMVAAAVFIVGSTMAAPMPALGESNNGTYQKIPVQRSLTSTNHNRGTLVMFSGVLWLLSALGIHFALR